jgi:hypothetical protein
MNYHHGLGSGDLNSVTGLAESLFQQCDVQWIDGVNAVGLSDHNHDAAADRDEIRTKNIELSAIGQVNRERLKAVADSILDPLNIHQRD